MNLTKMYRDKYTELNGVEPNIGTLTEQALKAVQEDLAEISAEVAENHSDTILAKAIAAAIREKFNE